VASAGVLGGSDMIPEIVWIFSKLELGGIALELRIALHTVVIVAGFILLPRKEVA
jgi:hypothetical protein